MDRAAQLDGEGDYMAHLYAMFLLAQFRETRAYPLMVRFALLPGNLLDSSCGDFLTMDLGRVLASVCGGELEGIQSVIENEDADEWARGAALSSLVTLVAAGQKGRDEIVSYFAQLFRGKLTRQWSHVWDALVSYTSDLYAGGTASTISNELTRRAWSTPVTLVLRMSNATWRWAKTKFSPDWQTIPHLRLVEDTVAEMGWWACFRDDKPSRVNGTCEVFGEGHLEAGRGVFSDQGHKAQDRQK